MQPDLPNRIWYFAGLCVLAGIGYALAGVCNLGAVQHLKLSTFQSASKLSAFLPVLVFHYVLGEPLSSTQTAGILLSSFPIMMLAFVEPQAGAGAENGRAGDVKKGLFFLTLYIALTSALQIVNVLTVKDDVDFSLGVDPILFVMCTNLAACPILIGMIARAGERVVLTPKLIRPGVVAGTLNALAFGTYLIAIELGPASSVVPLYSYNAFVSVALVKAFPAAPTTGGSRRATVVLLFLLAWGAISINLLVAGPPQ